GERVNSKKCMRNTVVKQRINKKPARRQQRDAEKQANMQNLNSKSADRVSDKTLIGRERMCNMQWHIL
ncbi:MAG: hypothetical protein K0U78_12230, partial [Actinomycetia bacterium]|nr:hypothetical protein [Actinomycetes bacterium]